jgi:hypothetical protein
VGVSWESLDRTREDKERRIAEDEEKLSVANAEVVKMMAEVVRRQAEQSELLERLKRNKLILKQAHERAKAKAVCLIDELEEEEEEERSKKRKRGEVVSPELFDFSAFFPSDGSEPVDWSVVDLPGGKSIERGESSSSAT